MPTYISSKDNSFPSPETADPDGLLAVGGDLTPGRVLEAYKNGIFPWYAEGSPILWWSPDPRMILFPENFIVSDSLRRLINKKKFIIKFDQNFYNVIQHCAKVTRKHEDGTWITEEMIQAYCALYENGVAHSVETYLDGKLVGGLYGISLGKAFFGESMFHLMKDASKVALYYLVNKLKTWDFHFIDAQIETDHLVSLGSELVPRSDFLVLLHNAMMAETMNGRWR